MNLLKELDDEVTWSEHDSGDEGMMYFSCDDCIIGNDMERKIDYGQCYPI